MSPVAVTRSVAPVRDGVACMLLGGALRLLVVWWAAPRFPPADDGRFYQLIAERIAAGAGYTWTWPDGTVSYAAHYPVGYPALLAAFYAVFGSRTTVAMTLHAVTGALAVLAAHRVAASAASRVGAALAAALVALHPALLAYTAALMTEGVTGSLLVVAVAIALGSRIPLRLRIVASGVLLGLMVSMRPQCALLAPVIGMLCVSAELGPRRWWRAALGVTAIAALCCAPWALRNCARMDRCVAVSANGGWNLLIGTLPEARGGFVPVESGRVPSECRRVFGEAAKDACFGGAALRVIAKEPLRWLALVPDKLAATFDPVGAPGAYLSAANPGAFAAEDRRALAIAEVIVTRLALLLSLVATARIRGRRWVARRIGAALGVAAALTPWAWLAQLVLVANGALLGRALFRHAPACLAVAAVAATAATHALFFGGARYALFVLPALAVLAGCASPRPTADTRTEDPEIPGL